jgi:hypothetical protein
MFGEDRKRPATGQPVAIDPEPTIDLLRLARYREGKPTGHIVTR